MPEAAPPAETKDAPTTCVPVAMWVSDKLVCVEIVDAPAAPEGEGVCRCPACHGAAYVDLAAQFYPKG